VTERIQKYLAHLGLGSRREIENWIKDGRIFVDGSVASPGIKVNSKSSILFDGRYIPSVDSQLSSPRLIMYHKRVREICSRKDPKNRNSVFDHLPKLDIGRWISVGRLDFNTTGLLLFTNDGVIANSLMHPRFGLEREYLCRVHGSVSTNKLNQLRSGVLLDGHLCRFKRFYERPSPGVNYWYGVVVEEGRYREIRRMWSSIGCTVNRLIRIRYGSIVLPVDLKSGSSRDLDISSIPELALLNEEDLRKGESI